MEEQNMFLWIKAAVTALCAAFSAAFGWLGWLVLAWAVCMVIDWISGSAAAASKGEWSSAVARAGIWHKAGMVVVVIVAAMADGVLGVAVENLPRWAAGKDTAMITVILFSVWKNMGYYMVIYLAGLQGCNPDLNEAAELDGANRWQQFWHITLPQLRPTTFFVVIMLTISGFKVYDQMYMITQGGPGTATMTLVYYIYNVAFVNTPKYGYASAISMVLFVLVLIVTIIQFRGSKGEN
mgnify:CR=1 FL=1